MKKQVLLLLIFCFPVFLRSQVVYQDLTRTSIYDFIDELATLKLIELHSVIKPYSRKFIAEKLAEAEQTKDLLNKRQRKQLEFYLKDYNLELQKDLSYLKRKKGAFRKRNDIAIPLNPLSFQYKDSLFTLSLRPIYGLEGLINNNSNSYNRWGGAEVFGYVGKRFGFYASLRDVHQEKVLVTPQYITPLEGGNWKLDESGGGDYSEMRGGVTFTWNWGSVALVKDHFQWGDNYHGSEIISGRSPSFPYLQLTMNPVKWFTYNYVAGWLISEVIDSSRTYTIPNGHRDYFFNKFLAASMFTFNVKNMDISIGNSAISCAPYFNPAYLSPFLFYANFSYSGDSAQKSYYGKNSQTFFNFSFRGVKHLHLYASVFIDDLRLGSTGTASALGFKTGFRVSNFLLNNVSLAAEYTFNNQYNYTSVLYNHSSRDPVLTFASNRYGLGSYLLNNSQEFYGSVGYIPLRGLSVLVSYLFAERGPDPSEITDIENLSVPLLKDLTWNEQAIGVSVRYEFLNNAFVYVDYTSRNTGGEPQYTPEMFQGKTNTITIGFNIGY